MMHGQKNIKLFLFVLKFWTARFCLSIAISTGLL